jgi:hypothetical protein
MNNPTEHEGLPLAGVNLIQQGSNLGASVIKVTIAHGAHRFIDNACILILKEAGNTCSIATYPKG